MIDSPANSSPMANMLQSHLPELDHILGVKEETGVIRALPKKQDWQIPLTPYVPEIGEPDECTFFTSAQAEAC